MRNNLKLLNSVSNSFWILWNILLFKRSNVKLIKYHLILFFPLLGYHETPTYEQGQFLTYHETLSLSEITHETPRYEYGQLINYYETTRLEQGQFINHHETPRFEYGQFINYHETPRLEHGQFINYHETLGLSASF